MRFFGSVYTEPVFALLAAWSLGAADADCHGSSKLAAVAAFWSRPQALALALPVANRILGRRRGLIALDPLALGALGLPARRSSFGQPVDLLPGPSINSARGDAGIDESGPQRAPIAGNLLDLPRAWIEACWIAGILAIVGIWKPRHTRQAHAFLCVLALGVCAIVLFLTRRRFLVARLPILALSVPAALAVLSSPSGARAC